MNKLYVTLVQDLAELLSIQVALKLLTYLYPLSNALGNAVKESIDQDLLGCQWLPNHETRTIITINNLTRKIMEQGATVATYIAESEIFWQGVLLLNQMVHT